MASAKRRTKAAIQMVHLLSTIPDRDLGGFRIEVGVQAPTLAIAKQWVDNTPLLNVHFWQDPWGQRTGGQKVDILFTIKDHLLSNARWVIQRAMSLKLLVGRDSLSPSALQKRVVADILCSLGWNAGRYRTTMSLDPKAWWTGHSGHPGHGGHTGQERPTNNQVRPSINQVHHISTHDIQMGQVLDHLTKHFQGRDKVKKLVALVRDNHPKGHVPCPLNTSHVVKLNGWTPLRMKCKVCGHNLNAGDSYILFANMVLEGHVPPEKVGLGTMSTLQRDNNLVSFIV
jgi:hypothetical protein